MSLASCAVCWDDLCTCGHKYKDLSANHKLEIASAALGILKEDLQEALKAAGRQIDEKYRVF